MLRSLLHYCDCDRLSPFPITTMLLLFSLLFSLFSPLPSLSLNREGLSLLRFKSSLSDPTAVLASWNPLDATPCSWNGVTCHSSTHRVTSLSISGTALTGPISAAAPLCRDLRSLSSLSLPNNFINSSLPPNLAACRSLRFLDLSQNLLVGPIPASLSELPDLRHLNLSGNNFSGNIPTEFGCFRRLENLVLNDNLLEGTVPGELGNVTTLYNLHLAHNPFAPGPLSPELGNLTNLENLWLNGCGLAGEIPASFARLRSVKNLDLSQNQLTGSFPSWITELTQLIQLELYENSLSGELPRGMSNLTALLRFDASSNQIGGTIPGDLFHNNSFESLRLEDNQFHGSVPESVARSTRLYELVLFDNRFTGSIPSELGSNSPLVVLDVSGNQLSGDIPSGMCSKGALKVLVLMENLFSGKIPASLSVCRSLTRLRLMNNRLSGEVPVGIWGLPRIYLLELTRNSLSGHIANTISTASNLTQLLISRNRFSGPIPPEIGRLSILLEFSGSGNNFSGEIPRTLFRLKQLGILVLSDNELSGNMPTGVESLQRLNVLNLANNRLTGEIPPQIGALQVLNYLDLSRNQLSGKIPLQLQNLKLNLLNLSSNLLSGDVPPLYAKEVYRNSFLGNPGLCQNMGGSCSHGGTQNNGNHLWVLWLIFAVAGVLISIVGIVWLYSKRKKNIKNAEKAMEVLMPEKWKAFHRLGFSEADIANCLNESNVIGSGSAGKVYKAVLRNGEEVAVKKLWGVVKKDDDRGDKLAGKDTFEVEVETLGRIRHRNIVKLLCCYNGEDIKLLVYEYMPNGSLGDLLHRRTEKLLNWPARYRIARDAAEGLSYLHHGCVPPIIHRDVKSNNILVDGEFGARIADFGLAKYVRGSAGKGPESMSAIAGTHGYIAPEYAYTVRVDEKSDIYSFGVVILELVTGRLPLDPELDDKDLVEWVRSSSSSELEGVDHVIDPMLDSSYREEIRKVLNVGLLCTSYNPLNRPSMRWVVKMLQGASADYKPMTIVRSENVSSFYPTHS